MKSPSAEQIDKILTGKSNDELLAMLARPEDWQPQMLEAAGTLLRQRGFEIAPAPLQATASDPEFEDLQRVASYRELLKTLRPRGIGSIIWGLIAIGLGLAAMDASRLNVILAVIGVFLIIEGIWALVAPAPVGMMIDGIALLLLGVWNLATTILDMSAGRDASPMFLVLGILQLGWAGQGFAKYAHFSKILSREASPLAVQKFDQLLHDLESASMTSDAALVEFVTSAPARLWKGQLRNIGGLFAMHSGRKLSRYRRWADGNLLVATRQEVSFLKDGDGIKPDTVRVAISIRGQKMSGVMPREALQRYEAWKIGIRRHPDTRA